GDDPHESGSACLAEMPTGERLCDHRAKDAQRDRAIPAAGRNGGHGDGNPQVNAASERQERHEKRRAKIELFFDRNAPKMIPRAVERHLTQCNVSVGEEAEPVVRERQVVDQEFMPAARKGLLMRETDSVQDADRDEIGNPDPRCAVEIETAELAAPGAAQYRAYEPAAQRKEDLHREITCLLPRQDARMTQEDGECERESKEVEGSIVPDLRGLGVCAFDPLQPDFRGHCDLCAAHLPTSRDDWLRTPSRRASVRALWVL